jgi:hypothetical protein
LIEHQVIFDDNAMLKHCGALLGHCKQENSIIKDPLFSGIDIALTELKITL